MRANTVASSRVSTKAMRVDRYPTSDLFR